MKPKHGFTGLELRQTEFISYPRRILRISITIYTCSRIDRHWNQSGQSWNSTISSLGVFQEAIVVLMRNGGRAERGNAMNYKLGESDLSLDSIEGHIAYVVYGKSEGVSITRRITPIACILIRAGVCKAEPGELVIKSK